MFSIKIILKRLLPMKVWENLVFARMTVGIARKYHQVKKINNRVCRDKIKWLFIVQRTEVFQSVRTIFEKAVKDIRCEVYILPLPRCINTSAGQSINMDSFEEVLNFCAGLEGARILQTYDEARGRFRELEKQEFDYIFLNVPYTEQYPEVYSIEKLTMSGKVCFVPYGYTLGNVKKFAKVYQTEFNERLMGHVSFLFCDSVAAYKLCRDKMWLSECVDGRRSYELGYPRFDAADIVDKPHEKFTALWMPRWTTANQADFLKSTFLEYKDVILKYFKEDAAQTRLIARPHPVAFENYVKCGIMSAEEVHQYKMQYVGNLQLDENADYLDTFAETDVLIADFSSLIIEFFLTGRPIIYCGEKTDFNEQLGYVADTFYYASGWKEVEKYLNLLKAGLDTNKEIRDMAVERFKKNVSHSGERIFNCLMEDKHIDNSQTGYRG